jgi:hypothetical protein
MKKMNLSLGRIGRMLLPVFLFMGLFFLSANTMNAQSAVAKLKQHISKLPDVTSLSLPSTKSMANEVNNPSKANDLKIGLETAFGRLILEGISREGFDKKQAIDKTYDLLNEKISAEYLDPVREIYRDLLL